MVPPNIYWTPIVPQVVCNVNNECKAMDDISVKKNNSGPRPNRAENLVSKTDNK